MSPIPLLPDASALENFDNSLPLVLAVDDHLDSLQLITCAAELFGCRCISTDNPNDVLSIVITTQPRLVLLDVLLPRVSGIDVLRKLREDLRTRSVPVIAVTALASECDRKRLMAAGFTDYLSKPYMLEDLDKILRLYI
ncbi:MAG: response regulator [Leptolyngbyaceae cyanobacterium SL_1_1]|nr:response regulator [Leptolyngbyaceae cyanobacterium RM2_2_21]NJN01982.1 response regulator [Leptolyngbyaceae cyanobacterium RM1_1_2]NJO10123.1 response regulator [Leptolyngbyaceae cyanobacterium SL_1_1]